MKKIVSIIICLSLVSCITQKRCNEKYPVQITTKDSISIKVVEKTYTVTIPSESVVIHDSIPCPYFDYKKEVKHNNMTAKVVISKGKLTVECKSDSLEKLLHTKDSIITNFHSEVKISPPLTVYKDHWYDIPCRWMAAILLVIVIIKIVKLYLKAYKPI